MGFISISDKGFAGACGGLFACLFAVVFLVAGCGGGAGSGSGGSSSDGSVGMDPGKEVSALYGVNENAGEFDISIDSSGAMAIAAVNSSLAGLSGTSYKSGTTVTLILSVSNNSWSSLGRVRLMIGGLPSGVTISGNDGHNFYSLGDIGFYRSASATVMLNNVAGAMSFKVYVTQEKEDRPSAVLHQGSGSSGSASLFKFKNNGKSAASLAKALSGVAALSGTAFTSGGANVSLKIDAYGNPKASYLDPDSLDLKYVYWDGSAYQNVTVYSTGKVGFYSSLALTSQGNPRIASYSAEDSSGAVTGDLRYSYCNSNCGAASSWGGVSIDTVGDTGGHTSIALDNSDPNNPKPRIVYYDFTNQDLKFAFCDADCHLAASWTIYTIDSAGNVGQYASLALTSTGGPKISYYDYSNGNLKYASCSGSVSTWCDTWYTTTVDSSSNDVGAYTSIVLYNDAPRISYYDVSNGDLKYAWYGSYSTGNGNLGAEFGVYGGTSSTQPYGPTILQYTNGSGQTRYRMYYAEVPNSTCGYFRYRDTTDSNPPSSTNLSATIKTMWQGWYAGQGCFGVNPMSDIIPIGGGKYREYRTFRNDEYQHWIDFSTTTTTDGTLPYCDGFDGSVWSCSCSGCTTNLSGSGTNGGTAAPQSTGDPPISQYYSVNPTVIQYVNGSGQTRYRLYYAVTDQKPVYFAYRDTSDSNAPWCTQWGPTVSGDSGDGWDRLCKTGNISIATQINVVTDYEHGRAEIIQLADGKWRMYYSQDGKLVYVDTTDTQPPGTSNIGDMKQLNMTGYGPELVQTATGYRLYYYYTSGGYRKIFYRDTTDTNPPTASGTTSNGWKSITLDDSMFICTHTSANGLGPAWFYDDMGAFSSLTLDVNGRPRISYYHNGYWNSYGSTDDTVCDEHNTEGDLMYAQCISGDCTSRSGWDIQALDTANDTGWFTSTASTAGGHAFIAYYDATLNDLKIYTVSTNVGAQQTLAIGGSTSNNADGAEAVRMDSGKYRFYYHINNGTYKKIAYRETTDTNPPALNGSNLGSETVLYGTSASDDASFPEILRLSDNRYRLYYKFYDGSTRKIAYRDTYDTNPPTLGSNLGTQTSLGVATSRMPDVVRFSSGGKYRMYYADFSATYGRLAYRDTTTTDWSLPGASNIESSATLLGFGGTSAENINGPNVVAMPGGKYRLYYTRHNGTYNDLAYRDSTTTDGSLPGPSNLGPETLFGLGASSTNQAGYSEVIALTGGKYRMYYARYDGASWQLAYRDTTTTDGSLPGASNLGAETVMGITGPGAGGASAPEIRQLADGKWRIYYSYYNTYYELAFRETTDANPPSDTNIGPLRYLYTGSASPNPAFGPEVAQFDDGSKYRVYYMTNNTAWEIAYKDTTDANLPQDLLTNPGYLAANADSSLDFKIMQKPGGGYRLYETGWISSYRRIRYRDTTNADPPDSSNVSSTATLMLGGTSTEDAASPDIIELPSGRFRIYYDYRNPAGTGYLKTAYRDTTDTNLPDASNLSSVQLPGVGGSTYHAMSPELLLTDSGTYRFFYTNYTGTYGTLYFFDTTDGDPPTAY